MQINIMLVNYFRLLKFFNIFETCLWFFLKKSVNYLLDDLEIMDMMKSKYFCKRCEPLLGRPANEYCGGTDCQENATAENWLLKCNCWKLTANFTSVTFWIYERSTLSSVSVKKTGKPHFLLVCNYLLVFIASPKS